MNGNDLQALGFKPGAHFKAMLELGNNLEEHEISQRQIFEALTELYEEACFKELKIPLQKSVPYSLFLEASSDEFEQKNFAAVEATMQEVMKTPTVVGGYIMPDACPAGPLGTIPVGGVVIAKNAIHPGMHSADICCSMFLTSIDAEVDVKEVLDVVEKVSHFGTGGRKEYPMGHGHAIIKRAENNRFLAKVLMFKAMSDQLATQGDGNHFFYVGKKESTGELTFVTHHGSRKPGALLYKEGMRIAESFRKQLSPDTLKQNAWIPANSDEGKEYWEALQIIREWTKYNHEVIHREVLLALGLSSKNITDTFWNEHNFVFKKDDLFYHAKGSTPVWGTHAHDADIHGRTIIPLNMGEPILIVKNHKNNSTGFAPHGAGRNYSRTAFKKLNARKTVEKLMEEQTSHIDARFYSKKADSSELPTAYKNAAEVTRQIKAYELANIVDKILPLGSIMAGEQEQFWRKRK